MMGGGFEGAPELARLQGLHRQNLSGTSDPKKPSRLGVVIGPKDAPLSIRMTQSVDDTFRGIVGSQFSNVTERERRNSNHIRLHLTVRFDAPSDFAVLTPVEEPDASWISFDSDGTLLFADYIQRVEDARLSLPVVVRSLEDLARDMHRIFTIAEQLYPVVAGYDGPLYVGLSLTHIWGAALQSPGPPPQQQAQMATWHTEVELRRDRAKASAMLCALSSLLRDLQYRESEQPVKEALETLGYEVELKDQKVRVEEDDKIRERALLLKRFYWKDKIFDIGKAANIPYFTQFDNYWDTDHYLAALEISKPLNDQDLLRLVSHNPPKYGLRLGGFQGKYYSTTEDGEVRLSSSWDQVTENVQTALEKWGEKAYGVMQALINLGGKAAFFDLVNEIENVLGYEFVPSYHLPRMASIQLVFKTGSNKYPDWTMPPEIVPVVEQELKDYTRPATPRPTKSTVSSRVVVVEGTMEAIATEIVTKRRDINFTFMSRFGTRLFRQNEMATADIRKPCSNEEDFNNRILNLTNLLDGIRTEDVTALVIGKTPDPGSINLLEAFLEQEFPDYDTQIITNLRMINRLRSKKYPIHADTAEFMQAMRYFGCASFPPDWQDLWEAVLGKYLDTLKTLHDLMQ